VGMHGFEVATCCVAILPLHDFRVSDNTFIYGGEGGFLREANQLHLRVLADQDWLSRENFSLFGSMLNGTAVRLVVSSEIWLNDPIFYYLYVGLFRVWDWRLIISDNGFIVYEYYLERTVDMPRTQYR
jgi:hypothetical protein